MANNGEIKSKSWTGSFFKKTFSGLGGGLKMGLALGLGAAALFSGIGIVSLIAGATWFSLAGAITAFIAAPITGGVVCGTFGTLKGFVQGLFSKPRPDGNLHMQEGQGPAPAPAMSRGQGVTQQVNRQPRIERMDVMPQPSASVRQQTRTEAWHQPPAESMPMTAERPARVSDLAQATDRLAATRGNRERGDWRQQASDNREFANGAGRA
jgi:hypothetical protein